jgi:hypothetical protein
MCWLIRTRLILILQRYTLQNTKMTSHYEFRDLGAHVHRQQNQELTDLACRYLDTLP